MRLGRAALRVRITGQRTKITDPPRPRRTELTEDEAFFNEHDEDPTAAFVDSLARDRKLLEEKERMGQATPEWKEYEEEVEAAIDAIESEWLTRPEPITKDTVKEARRVMEATVVKVQKKHQELNRTRLKAYETRKRTAIESGDRSTLSDKEKLPVSKEFAALLDRYQ